MSEDALLEGLYLASPFVILQVLQHLVIKRTVSGNDLLDGLHLTSLVVILQVLQHLVIKGEAQEKLRRSSS